MPFSSYHVSFKRGTEDWIIVTGEIRNDTIKTYKRAVFRIYLYAKDRTLASGIIKLHNLRSKSTKSFEVLIYGLNYQVIPSIVKHAIVLESGY